MYRIVCRTDGKEYPILDFRDEVYMVQSPKLTLELNKTGSLVFYMNCTHPNYGCIKKITSILSVYYIRKNGTKKWLYSGRSMTDEEDFYRTGKIECEGILALLLDSIVRDYTFQGTQKEYFTYLINQHNAHVGPEKQFLLGEINLDDTEVVRDSALKPNTLTEINSKMIKPLGCYVYARDENGTYYVDCVKQLAITNKQKIRFGLNILDIKRKTTASSVKTVMIGIGGTDKNGNKIEVEVEDATAVASMGRIEGKIEFPEVTNKTELKTKTMETLQQCLGYVQTTEVTAIDMNMVDEEIQELSLGYVEVISEPHEISENVLISKMVLELLSPEKNKYTLGVATKVYREMSDGVGKDYDEVIGGIIKSVDEVSNNVGTANAMLEGLF